MKLLRDQWRNFSLLFLCVTLMACGANPFKYTETPAQKAYAIERAYNIVLEGALDIVRSPAVEEWTKSCIRRVEAQTTPVINELSDAFADYEIVRAQLSQGESSDEKLTIAAANLEDWVRRAEAALSQLATAVGRGGG